MSERKEFLKHLDRHQFIKYLNLKGLGIEIGVQGGHYSKKILEYSDLHLILLDSWRYLNNYKDAANSELKQHIILLDNALDILIPLYDGRFTLIRELSEKMVSFFKDELFDFMYLDADHSEFFMNEELERWWPKLKYGGIMSGHDYVDTDDKVFGVKTAVDAFFLNKNINVEVCDLGGCCPTWFITKK